MREPQRHVLDDRAAEITATQDDAVEPEVIVHEGVEVAAVRGHVVKARRHIAVAEPPQVGDDDVEPRIGERRDHLPVDALGLGPSVHEQQRHPAHALSHVGLAQAARRGRVHCEAMRIDVRGVVRSAVV